MSKRKPKLPRNNHKTPSQAKFRDFAKSVFVEEKTRLSSLPKSQSVGAKYCGIRTSSDRRVLDRSRIAARW